MQQCCRITFYSNDLIFSILALRLAMVVFFLLNQIDKQQADIVWFSTVKNYLGVYNIKSIFFFRKTFPPQHSLCSLTLISDWYCIEWKNLYIYICFTSKTQVFGKAVSVATTNETINQCNPILPKATKGATWLHDFAKMIKRVKRQISRPNEPKFLEVWRIQIRHVC